MALLELHNIETYHGPVAAVRGVSFAVEPGAIVAILGANGAGKTTIMRTISGTLVPRAGRVTFDGREIQGLDPDVIAQSGLSHVPEGRQVFPHLTVQDNLRMGAFFRRDKAGVAADLEVVFDYFPILRERRTQRAGLLSGGEQQMLALSRAVMARPRLLLLDEPSLGLSPRLVKEIFAIVVRINREQGTTILLVEQNAAVALAVSHFAYALENGRIVAGDRAESLRERADIQKYYLAQHDDGIGAPVQRLRRSWL